MLVHFKIYKGKFFLLTVPLFLVLDLDRVLEIWLCSLYFKHPMIKYTFYLILYAIGIAKLCDWFDFGERKGGANGEKGGMKGWNLF
jgi:hypothetical protein